MILFWKHKVTEHGFCCISRYKVTNGVNASHVNVNFAADVLYIQVNPHVICKMESEVFCCCRDDKSATPAEPLPCFVAA